MERHITFTGETGETVTCSVYDVEDTLTAWYPDAPAEITELWHKTDATKVYPDPAARFRRDLPDGEGAFAANPDWVCPMPAGEVLPDCGSICALLTAASGVLSTGTPKSPSKAPAPARDAWASSSVHAVRGKT